MTCHSDAERIGEFGDGADVGDEVDSVGEARIDGDPFLFTSWRVYIHAVAVSACYQGVIVKQTEVK